MKNFGGIIRLAATDLSNHLSCGHLTSLNISEMRGERTAPPFRAPDLIVMQQRGLQHEQAYIHSLVASGLSMVDLNGVSESGALVQTQEAMDSGADIIVQGALKDGSWFGRPDVLRKTDVPSGLGDWSYEPYDCKLSRETKAATILQLSHYAALLAVLQGREPENMYVVPPSDDFTVEAYRVLDFAAYYRAVKLRLERATAKDLQTSAEPTEHCEVCRWWPDCNRQWRREDLPDGRGVIHNQYVQGCSLSLTLIY